jgi:hypothetical protein
LDRLVDAELVDDTDLGMDRGRRMEHERGGMHESRAS